MAFTADEINKIVDGVLHGDPKLAITGPCKIEEGFEGGVSFLSNLQYEKYLYNTSASLVLISKDLDLKSEIPCSYIIVENSYESFAKVLNLYNSEEHLDDGIHESAVVSDEAMVSSDAKIGALNFIGKGSSIGNGSKIYPSCYIGNGVQIGSNCTIYPGVRIYRDCIIGDHVTIHSNCVIGSDGFGFAMKEGKLTKIDQIGNVVIEDHVEIGASTVIDRATLGSTIIHKGVKLDNLIQIAHNVTIGENTVIAAQTGIAGSVKIGKANMIGGQAGFRGHIKTGTGVQIQAQSGIMSDLEDGRKMFGSPAIDYTSYLKAYAIFKQLPDLAKRIHNLEKQLKDNNQ